MHRACVLDLFTRIGGRRARVSNTRRVVVVLRRLSGFTEKETLKTWTVLLSTIAIVGITMTLILSKVMPLK